MAIVGIYPGATDRIVTGGVPVVAVYAGALGGLIGNPLTIQDQGLAGNEEAVALLRTGGAFGPAFGPAFSVAHSVGESLFVDFVNPATLMQVGTTIELFPGQTLRIPSGLTTNVTVNAGFGGHTFSVVVFQTPPVYPPVPIDGAFPPQAPTSLTKTINSYLYQKYNDDDSLQAFVMAYNALAQNYVDAFNGLNLPVYTSANINGALLDWVAAGLYGILRPALASGRNKNAGAFNTYKMNTLTLGHGKTIYPTNAVVTSDDVFKRILTWLFFKGDGKVFNVRWLKRRIMRFLNGENGVNVNVDQTYRISVTFGAGNNASIRVVNGQRKILGGALFNSFLGNRRAFDSLTSSYVQYPPIANVLILQEAINAGALELPFQYNWTVQIN